MGFAPAGVQRALAWLEPYGFLAIVALLYLHRLDPVIAALQSLLYQAIGALLP